MLVANDLHFLLCCISASSYVCFPNVEKLTTIARTVAKLLLTAAWIVASTANLIHDALHHNGGAPASASHQHGLQSSSTAAQVDTPDAHATSAVVGCFFCANGSLLLLTVVVALLLLPRFFRRSFSNCFSAIAYHRFLLPALRAPPQLG